jgi:4-carboxymuconolactone decarboxylase
LPLWSLWVGWNLSCGGHTRAAIKAGLTPTEVLETVIHTVQYSGFPRALNAIRVVTDALIELGVELPPPSPGDQG